MDCAYHDGELLRCCLCGEIDIKKLIVQNIGIAVGMGGSDYSFCKKCLFSKDFGKKLLREVGYPDGIILRDSAITKMKAR